MQEDSIWIVAVSGGPDSMALLDVLYQQKTKIIAAHVNYLTRETSLRDENIVRDYCEQRGIPFHIKKFKIEKEGNFQQDAREFRYEFFKELVEEYGARGLATGHHFNDDLETYIFQKQRKMYSDTMGMAVKTKIKGVLVWRPLLEYKKKDILDYCKTNKIKYGIDESNFELDYTRNKIRNSIENLSKEDYKKLVEEMHLEKKEWNQFREAMFDSVNSWELLLPLKTYAKIRKRDRFLYLRAWLRTNAVDVHEMSEDYLKEIDHNIIKKSANYQFDNLKLMSSYENISLFKVENYNFCLEEIEYFETDYFKIVNKGLKIEGVTVSKEDFPLKIRNVQKGDKIQMRYGNKKVHRYFIDEKTPHSKRFNWPVLENAKKELIFVPGIGCSVHHYSNNPSFYMLEC